MKRLIALDKAAITRLKSPAVSYMEIKKDHFQCEYCTFLNKPSLCMHPRVLSKVSAARGCCNLFNPEPGNKVNSKNWDFSWTKDTSTFLKKIFG
ncbi:MAG: hypothetical protein PHT07_15370 [Paludibacter sp.]|nr:hypothetical protein [Paludibacter sp.]